MNRLAHCLRILGLAAAVAFGLAAAGTANAYPRGHAHIGVWVGGPFWWGGPYAYYPYSYPYVESEVIVQQPAEPVFVAPSAAQQAPTWYYCREARMYYPYVNQCPGGWQEVPARPPPNP
ncbi:MAG TPA: hypothetical protein VE029_13845 [Rhizobacter sp.]|nr:hypothetical protein [Rhizobacter sp.]